MPERTVRLAAIGSLIGASMLAAAVFSPLAAQENTGGAFCDLRSGHAWQIRSFLTSAVSLYSLQGEHMTSVPRNSLRGVTTAIACDNTTSYVKVDTSSGPRLLRRSSLVLGGGLGPPCRCASSLAPNEHASNNDRNASSMGAAEGAICNADLPCER